ncbi:MAG: aspartate ammonia-lyase [candidate division Zixibacteria bacterium]|nr:aspartate ammonia-lyase [candidate division Zixibacteria bacterium]
MNIEEIKNLIAQVDLFADLDTAERNLIAGAVEVANYEADSLLFVENSPRNNMWIIHTGQVELFKKTTFGAEKRLAFFGQYDFLGEGAMFDDYPHSTSARTLIESTLLKISRDTFRQLCTQQPSIAPKMVASVAKVISRRMRQASSQVANVAAQYVSGETRREHDLLGDLDVPNEYYYGIQTLRALHNFPISGIPINHFPALIDALAMVKLASARANAEMKLLKQPIADAIEEVCQDIINGKFHTHFVVDMIQGGAGTSTNMNANEVIANRALEILGHTRGSYKYCHPNIHVNMSQSTNDVYPTALDLALIASNRDLTAVLSELVDSFRAKAIEFENIIKMGRTQLQDAVPMTLGQEFEAYASTLGEEITRLDANAELFLEINLGGTAIGTGINAVPGYAECVLRHLREVSGLNLQLAPNLVEGTQDTGAFVMYSSAVKRLAVKLSKIANDLRLLSSGPRAGFNEINLPARQPGSSIMPGKVNPVIPEVVNQIAYKVIGNDLTVTLAAEAGQLELNVMEPIIAQSIFESTEMLKNGMATFKFRCIDGITANERVCRLYVTKSIGIITALNPILGYEICSKLAKEALDSGRGVYELVLERKLLTKAGLDKLLAPENMLAPRSKMEE